MSNSELPKGDTLSLPKGWRECKLGDAPLNVIDGDRGVNYPKKSEMYSKGYCVFLSTKNVTINGFDFTETFYITKEKDEQLRKGKLSKYDVILTTRGTVGNIAFYNDNIDVANVRINSGMVIIRSTNMYPTFTYYQFKYLSKSVFYEYISGSAQPQLPIRDLKKIPINLPPLAEQKAIAEVLSSLDDKIDLLHKQNQTLEDMAQTLFREWFIEKADEGWEEVPLSEVVETTSGGTPSRKNMDYYINGKYNWIKSKELNRSFIDGTEEKITEEALKKSSAKLLPKNSILIAMYGATVGEYAITTKEMTCNQAICAVKPNKDYPYTFLFMWIKNLREEILNMAIGSAQQNISQALIKQLMISKNINLIKNYHSKVYELFEKIQINQNQIKTLEQTRDTLLPKLMSGQVRVV
ncbi:restriction endonuclease subunit S [Francisella sp. XLW-1]|uniref:restriction endonuclease subunit S n=1 Tax=Francisella sp. XLW-1 TaxID=2610887 RepID=UPI00123CD3ED|nr:restriction endonuclease subunit S [Francisella sp. XLW-1]